MEKSPAFQFYPKDFLVDTALLTNEQCGIYIKLMCFSWVGIPGCKQTELPNDPSTLARIAAVVGEDFLTKIEPVIALFLPGEEGKIYHKRLRKELKKQAKHRRQRVSAGKASAKARQRALNERSEPVERKPNSSSASSSSPSSSSPEGKGEEPPTPPAAPLDTGEAVILKAMDAQAIMGTPAQKREHVRAWRARGKTAGEIEAILMEPEVKGWHVWDIDKRHFKVDVTPKLETMAERRARWAREGKDMRAEVDEKFGG